MIKSYKNKSDALKRCVRKKIVEENKKGHRKMDALFKKSDFIGINNDKKSNAPLKNTAFSCVHNTRPSYYIFQLVRELAKQK